MASQFHLPFTDQDVLGTHDAFSQIQANLVFAQLAWRTQAAVGDVVAVAAGPGALKVIWLHANAAGARQAVMRQNGGGRFAAASRETDLAVAIAGGFGEFAHLEPPASRARSSAIAPLPTSGVIRPSTLAGSAF